MLLVIAITSSHSFLFPFLQELIKEVIRGKRKLKEKEDELKETREQLTDLRAYLDNILVRVMETNPTILSSSP